MPLKSGRLLHPPVFMAAPHSAQDALTDLTGDAERLPVEGHRGTWLGHKVLAAPGRACTMGCRRDSAIHKAYTASPQVPGQQGGHPSIC